MAKDTTASSGLAPFFQKIETLTKPQRIGIYVGSLVLIIGLAGWLLFWPKKQTIDTLNVELASVKEELLEAIKDAEKLNYWRTQMKKKEVKYKQVMKALPEKEEIPSLLAGVSQAGKDAGLEFVLFQPKPETEKDFYSEIPVDINVTGSYHNVAIFFDKVSNLPRIVNIRNIIMEPKDAKQKGGSGHLKTTCQAVTYKFLDPKSSKKSKKKKRGRKGKSK